ncbi:hypothetical protein POJ06DRAFT_301829 [Lipomyces tetrasporus]|uniref:DNA replication complex GINS protein PSF2 n=1 Tax=Lipomyces tetrasporus TaxID=54092 RepID=A0AAD7QS83_9ASCO|nr:uncharacterized protein POJ06DRAFT_301829 [Lipomyces tetrasporus]KAJ8099996.1 hypothetical protein POJ06DRAFT_301829 [Lipomyces tetrasporus]
MALPAKQVGTFVPSEISFLAENNLVTIIPRQAMESVALIGGMTPSMRPMRRIEVPIWVALLLKKQSRCNIVPPQWLSEENLKITYDAEVSNMTRFSANLPWEWIEVGELILGSAPDDLSSPPHVIRNLLRDIREVRQAKARAGLKNLNESYLQLDNVGGMELNEIRSFVTMAMNRLRIMQSTREGVEQQEDYVEPYNQEDDDDGDDDDYNLPQESYDDSMRTSKSYHESYDTARLSSRMGSATANERSSIPSVTSVAGTRHSPAGTNSGPTRNRSLGAFQDPTYTNDNDNDDSDDDDDDMQMDENYLNAVNSK